MEHCKKLSSWDIYGVRKFPYRGRRKYSPGIYRSFYGSITITNDVFGLTILQFEREFKSCLTRRNHNEQRILNIRFPDKTANKYIEYLKYGDDTVRGCKSIVDQTVSKELRIFRNLIQVAGTELEIRTRQRMFNIIDQIKNRLLVEDVFISSGSLAEGIDLPGSDIDTMWQLKEVTVIDDLKYLYTPIGHTTLFMEHDVRYPGFCKLKLVAEGSNMSKLLRGCFKDAQSGVYISAESFIHLWGHMGGLKLHIRHGPCLSDANQYTDIAICLRSQFWPTIAMNWKCRHRAGQWPTENVIDTIVNDGCLFVAIGPKNDCNEFFWRISFSLAEKRLTHSMNYTQLLCYVLLKLTLKNIINRNEDVEELLCSYFLKTTVFWLSEEICIDTFQITNLSYCFSLCIDKLMSFVRNCYCPNYFIPRHNMFIGKVDESNNKLLLSILSKLSNTELKVISDQIFGKKFIYHSDGTTTNKNQLSVKLDFLFFRVLNVRFIFDFNRGYKTLQYINLLMESESSEFLFDVLRHYHAVINQQIAQMLVLPQPRITCCCGCCRNENIIRRCVKHLTDGTKTDALSGWLLFASLNYKLEQYKTTLQIVEHVLPRCTHDMIQLENVLYTTQDMDNYKHKTENHLTLNHKMRQATIKDVYYIEQSTLIPQELQLEVQVQDEDLFVPPAVMCYCLQFLCYHHLGDVHNKQLALRHLHLTIQEAYDPSGERLSASLVILDVCYEISGDRDTAYHCYNKALYCEKCVCRSAEKRIENLFST